MTDIHYFGRFPYDDLDLIAARADELAGMAYAEQRRRQRAGGDDD